jgi:hypothetical protein
VRYALLLSALSVFPWATANTILENPLWRVELEPATLAIRVTPAQHPAVQASAGVAAHTVGNLRETAHRADWQWDDGAWIVSAELTQRDLVVSIKARAPGDLEFLKQPGSAMGRGLIWPLAEGHYVPADDALWQEFLLRRGKINTTQDLSLPMWGVDHGGFTLNWLMVNPYNNRLAFSADGERVGLAASHEFTSLDPTSPLTFMLVLGEADLLAGAKRYRQWLIDKGRYETLSEKRLKTPEAAKLFGASHVYLWGNGLLGRGDVRNWSKLLEQLRSKHPLAGDLRGLLSAETLATLDSATLPLNGYQQEALLRGLNSALNNKARQSWQTGAQPDMQLLARRYGEIRNQVAELFRGALTADPAQWGGAFSVATFKQLRGANLPRLWLGLGDGWEGGLWHPETVQAGVAAGYLLAPYDSYDTALAPTDDPDWATGHLGQNAYQNCAIVLKNGDLKSGFQETGHYTDPHCIRPLLEARIKAVEARAGFNSWFLDVTATGMLFDSYRTGNTMTQAQNAAENAAAGRWINEAMKLPMGSESGNAVAAQGILFAHGMQTPVVGWDDDDLRKNQTSPYYLGDWYPPEQPSVFFKAVPMKEPYRTIHFAPVTRLPLYQAVFHGSVITTHHWLFDSLKLSNVRAENELMQLLYNVPPLYHLSAATLKQRLPVIQHQDEFFRPLHERLATEALIDFRWLSEDRQVQQTVFSNGTRLIANFDSQTREVDGKTLVGNSITAFEVDGKTIEFQVKVDPSIEAE